MIQVAWDEWIVMREFPQQPKAVIRAMRDTSGDVRYILSSWDPVRHRQRMIGVFEDRDVAEKAVPWPTTNPPKPGPPESFGPSMPPQQRKTPPPNPAKGQMGAK